MFSNFLSATAYEHLLLAFAILPFLVLVLPTLMKYSAYRGGEADLFAPPLIVAGTVFIGTTLRTFFVLHDPEAPQFYFVLFGPYEPLDVMHLGLIANNLGVAAWLLGYVLFGYSSKSTFQNSSFDYSRLNLAVMFILPFCIALTFYYMYQVGVLTNISQMGLSAKRMIDIGAGEDKTTTFQHLKLGADVAAAATVLVACRYYSRLQRGSDLYLLVATFCVASIVPFVSSIRGEIAYLAVSILIVRHYSYRKINGRLLLMAFAGLAAMAGFMQTLRVQSKLGSEGNEFEIGKILDSLIYTAHHVCVGKMSAIIAKIPAELPFMYGESYMRLLIAPIPRVLWPDKPVIGIGQYVGIDVMERSTISGVVPGVLGEAYLNFGWPGLVIILFLFGGLCRTLYQKFAVNRDRNDMFAVGLYAILWILILDVFLNAFTGNVLRFARHALPFILMAWYIRRLQVRKRYTQTPGIPQGHRFQA